MKEQIVIGLMSQIIRQRPGPKPDRKFQKPAEKYEESAPVNPIYEE